MITYDIVQIGEGVLFGWAVIAVDEGGRRRTVSRYVTLEQAKTMIDRLLAMMAAERVD